MIDLEKIIKFFLGWAEEFEKKGWLLYIIVGLCVIIALSVIKGCTGG